MSLDEMHGHKPLRPRSESAVIAEVLPGRVSFEQITAMDEGVLDERLAKHLDGQAAIIDSTPPLKEARRLEIKRAFLALLEGYQKGGQVLGDWLNRDKSEHEEPVSPYNVVGSMLKRHASEAYKQHLRNSRSAILFQAEMTHPPRPEVEKLLERINAALKEKGLPPLRAGEILARASVERDEGELPRSNISWTVEKLLNLFYATVSSDLNDEELSAKLGTTKDTVVTARKKYFTEDAKVAMRQARGFKTMKYARSQKTGGTPDDL